MLIPSGLKSLYTEAVNSLIDSNWGVATTLTYPAVKTVCPNCIVNTMAGVSSGRYKVGGPKPFTSGQVCPLCNGVGYKETSTTDTIRVLVYIEPKSWMKLGIAIQNPDGIIQVKGKWSDIAKVRKCLTMSIHNGISEPTKYERYGEQTPFGVGRDTYFLGFWKRVD